MSRQMSGELPLATMETRVLQVITWVISLLLTGVTTVVSVVTVWVVRVRVVTVTVLLVLVEQVCCTIPWNVRNV